MFAANDFHALTWNRGQKVSWTTSLCFLLYVLCSQVILVNVTKVAPNSYFLSWQVAYVGGNTASFSTNHRNFTEWDFPSSLLLISPIKKKKCLTAHPKPTVRKVVPSHQSRSFSMFIRLTSCADERFVNDTTTTMMVFYCRGRHSKSDIVWLIYETHQTCSDTFLFERFLNIKKKSQNYMVTFCTYN